MFRNLLTVSLRSLIQNRGYTLLHILGLTLGITCALFIMLYVVDEVSYDNFHSRRDRLYRINTTILEDGKEKNYPSTQIPLAVELETKYTDVERCVRFIMAGRELFENPDRKVQFYEEKFCFADASVFNVFTFPLLEGDPGKALLQPNTAVVTLATALKYFGTKDAIGKTFMSKGKQYSVTGIAMEPPANSSIQFDALLSFATFPSDFGSWDGWYPDTYVLIAANRTPADVTHALTSITAEHVAPLFKDYNIEVRYWLQQVTDLHLRSNFGDESGDGYEFIQIFLAIGVFVILIACINYINLATARATRRAKEIGIRKTIGSTKGHIIFQFVTESTLLTIISLLLSVMVTITLLPYFNELAGKSIGTGFLLQGEIVAYGVALSFVMGVVSGSYPAFYLSRFNPALVLKGNITRGAGNARLRKVLVSVQFAISIAMLICTAVVYDQLQFMRSKDLGFNQEQVLNIELADSVTRVNMPVLYNRLKNYSQVVGIASSSSMPGKGINYIVMKVESADGVVPQGIYYYNAGYDFVETLGMTVVKGRSFSRNFGDSTAALINESMAKSLKWDDPIGKHLTQDDGNPDTKDRSYTVVGMVKDYHQSSLHSPIAPLALLFNEPDYFLNIKIRPDNIKHTIDFIGATWREVTDGKPFSYNFLDADFQSQYQADVKRGQIFSLFSAVCLIISCVGLFGLAAYTTEQRAREIGIRKVVGATVTNIVKLFYTDFLKLIAIGLLIAFPLSYFMMDNWLHTFAYQTGLNWINFIGSAAVTVFIVITTISFYAIRAALINPANTLRSE